MSIVVVPKMSDEEIERIATARYEINKNQKNQFYRQPLDCHRTGVIGEAAFADLYRLGYEQIRRLREGSDGGYDFEVFFNGHTARLTFDIKTRATTWSDLLVPTVKFKFGRCADYMVLARCPRGKAVEFLGWEDPKIVAAMPVQTEKFSAPTHVRELKDLHSMERLHPIMMQHDGFARPRETASAS